MGVGQGAPIPTFCQVPLHAHTYWEHALSSSDGGGGSPALQRQPSAGCEQRTPMLASTPGVASSLLHAPATATSAPTGAKRPSPPPASRAFMISTTARPMP